MNIQVKKYVRIICLGIFLMTIIIGIVSYTVVKRFTSRRFRDVAWYIKTNLYKQFLCDNHGAIPISFKAEDGLSLAGLLFIRENAHYNLLVCHGYSRHKEDVRNIVALFPQENILFFDYRAHGESEGILTSIGYHEILDVLAAVKVLQDDTRIKHLPIVGIGYSMGAATLLGAAVQGAPFKGLVIDSVFKRLDEQIAKMFSYKTGLPKMPFMPLCESIYSYLFDCTMSEVSPFEWIQKVTIPMLIIHAKNDTLADSSIAHELFTLKNGPKELWLVDQAPHARIFKHYPQEYAIHVNDFLNSLNASLPS